MEVLVTGGAGYIGSHTITELIRAGYDVTAADNYSNSSPEVYGRIEELTGKRIRTYQVDLQHEEELEQIFREREIRAVIHFAALKAVSESVFCPLHYYENNINSTIQLCKVMGKHHVKKLVFSSSATVYGHPDKVPISEDFPLRALNPYGKTKLILEEMLRDLHHADPEWSIAILRYFNPVGAHESGRIGEDPKGIPNNLMPYITKVALGSIQELQIFGNDYETHDGTGVRDYIHVQDLAAGHLKALKKIMPDTGVNHYNLGTGIGYSVLDVVRTFEKVTGMSIPYRFADPRPGDTGECFADPTKAQTELDWRAEKDLADMCRDAWRWQQNNPSGYFTEEIAAKTSGGAILTK